MNALGSSAARALLFDPGVTLVDSMPLPADAFAPNSNPSGVAGDPAAFDLESLLRDKPHA